MTGMKLSVGRIDQLPLLKAEVINGKDETGGQQPMRAKPLPRQRQRTIPGTPFVLRCRMPLGAGGRDGRRTLLSFHQIHRVQSGGQNAAAGCSGFIKAKRA